MHLLNLGILAHVDAGKTSLTERLLHSAGVIDEIGSVDAGSTQTDTLALERRRGITIKSAVVSFTVDDVTVNLIDTPGHPDFIAEVERVLGVLDGAVLVVSAVEGVQAQTRVLMRTLKRLRIPTLVFVNKTDRRGARYDGLLRDIAERLTPAVVPMGTVSALGTREARFLPGLGSHDVLADHDDDLLAAWVEGRVPEHLMRAALVAQTRQALVHPVYFGSAVTGAGVPELVAGIRELLPAADGDPEGPVSATVFKVDRGPAGEKVAYARLFSGTLRTRDRVPFGAARAEQSPMEAEQSPMEQVRPDQARAGQARADQARAEGRVTAVSVFDSGTEVRQDAVPAGRIAKLWGLSGIRIGDALGEPRTAHDHFFAPPSLETVVVPGPGTDSRSLHLALTQLAEQDPLIALRHDETRQETSVSSTARSRRRSSRPRSPRSSAWTSPSARPRRCASNDPPGRARPPSSTRRTATPSSPPSACGSTRLRSARACPSGWRWSSAPCRTRSSRPSRTPCTRPSARACTAGGSPTARSP